MKMICTDRFPIPRRLLLGVLLGGSMMSALAQFRVEISGVGLTQLPIAIAGFRDETQAPVKISAVIQADLERSIQTLRGLPADIWVTCHARWWGRYRKFVASQTSKNPVDPFIDPDGYRAYLDAAEQELRIGRLH